MKQRKAKASPKKVRTVKASTRIIKSKKSRALSGSLRLKQCAAMLTLGLKRINDWD